MLSELNRTKPEASPRLVDGGAAASALVLVLDPAGGASHGRLPASWRGYARSVHVAWYRMVDRSMRRLLDDERVRALLAEARNVHLVAAGAAAEAALALAAAHTENVRSLLLVSPTTSAEGADRSRPGFERQWSNLRALLKASGVHTELVDPALVRPGAGIAPLGLPELVSVTEGNRLRTSTRPARACHRGRG